MRKEKKPMDEKKYEELRKRAKNVYVQHKETELFDKIFKMIKEGKD